VPVLTLFDCTLGGLLVAAPPQLPIEITGDEARRKAVTELLDPVYAANQPPWWQRVASWVMGRIGDAVAALTGSSAGLAWVVVLVGVVALVVVVILRSSGGLRGTARQRAGAVVGATRSAAEHRALAERAAAAQDWLTAVVERFRATVRVLEERGVLDERPGRTADEVATDAPTAGDDTTLSQAAQVFDAVVYGEQSATEHAYALVVRADELAVRLSPQRAAATTTLAAPR
jgi:hypothetical protein